jgi:leucyl-tRNA synthetase
MRRQYPFHLIEPKWQRFWEARQTFRAWNPGDDIPPEHPSAKRHGLRGNTPAGKLPPKFYILDMFPYPSGAGLHVGFWRAIAAPSVSTSCIRWAGTPSDCRPNNTPSAPDSIREKRRKRISAYSSAR